MPARIVPWHADEEAEGRATELLGRMTIDEKIDLVTGDPTWSHAFYNAPIARLGIRALTMADGPAGGSRSGGRGRWSCR